MPVPAFLRVISKSGLEQLHRYVYQSGGYSPLDNKMNAWWEFAVKFVPMTLAPNVLTLTALGCLFASFLLTMAYCYVPGSAVIADAPSWVYFVCALLHFTYQTLDAIDGKQARRTKAGSPLGQLFDHGCDSVGCVFILLSCLFCYRVDFSMYSFLLLIAMFTPFFLAQWEEHHTHVLRTHTGGVGVTEGQMMSQILIVCSGVFGSDFWTVTVPVLGINVSQSFALFMCLAIAPVTIGNIGEVAKKVKGAAAYIDLIPISVLLLSCFLIRDTVCFTQAPLLCLLTAGCVFSHLTTQMIVCNVTHMPYPVLQPTALMFPVLVFNASNPMMDPMQLLNICAGFAFLSIARYVFVSIAQITETLGIYCLVLGARPEGKKNIPADVLNKTK